jgi:hypothetical protein
VTSATGKGARAPSKHDALAITALVSAFVIPPLALILGPVSIVNAHRDGRDASGLAIAATALGALFAATWVAVVIALAVTASHHATSSAAALVLWLA